MDALEAHVEIGRIIDEQQAAAGRGEHADAEGLH